MACRKRQFFCLRSASCSSQKFLPALNHTKLRIPMLSMFTTELIEKSTCTLVWKTKVCKLGLLFFSWIWMVFQSDTRFFLALPRAVGRFFVTGDIIASAEGTSLVGGSPCRRLGNAIFSTRHEICLRKIDLEDENGKQLQITIIKITESKKKTNPSTDLICLAQQVRGGGAAALRLCYHVELTRLIFLWHTHRLKASDWGCCGLNYSSAIPSTKFCLSNTSSSCSRSLWSSSIYIQAHYIGYFVHCLIVITLRTMFRCWLKRA